MDYPLFKYYGIDWVWFGASLYAVYLLGRKNKYGFVSMMVSDIAGFYMAYATKSVAVFIGSAAYLVLNVVGWINWNKKQEF